uniref:Tetratricopeptide repeat protein n=1 Tax=Parastrongyloides trichosuri TaxID=131310 RepID=A0A0N4Z856_PARTI
MGHAGGVGGQALGAAQADGQFEQAKRVQHVEGLGLAARQFQREGRAGALALGFEDRLLFWRSVRAARRQDGADARIGAQAFGQNQGVVLRPLHADVQGLQTAQQQPGGVRVGGRAADGPHLADARHEVRPAHAAARDQVRVAADVFGQGIEDEVGAQLQRALPQGAEEGVVDGDCRRFGLIQGPGARHRAGDVDQLVGWVGGGLQIDGGQAPARFFGLRGRGDHGGVQGVGAFGGGDADRLDAVAGQDAVEQVFGAAIGRGRIDDDVAGPHQGQHGGRDGCHTAGEDQGLVRLVPDRQAVLEDLQVRIVDARIDQAQRLVRVALAQAIGDFEEAFAVLGRFEDEGRSLEQRRLDRALRQGRIIAVAHHQGFRREGAVAEDARAMAVHFYVSSPDPVIADHGKARQTLSHGGEAPRFGSFDRRAAGRDQALRTR